MTITRNDLEFLRSEPGEALLRRLAHEDVSDSNTLKLLTQLRKDYPPEQAGAALEMTRLRLKAVDKFGEDAAKLFFTRDALEQASDSSIRHYRAGGVRGRVLDICCGIGSDALAFAAQGAEVVGYDLDEIRIAIARHNASVLGLQAQFVAADVRELTPDSADLIFYDPARRRADKRIYDVEQYIPPLSLVRNWDAPRIMVKLSPGVDFSQLGRYHGEIEFISVDGDLKEAVLHTGSAGDTAQQSPPVPFATLLTAGEVYHWRRTTTPLERPLSQPRAWLVEPDPALIRAGLVQDAAEAFDGYQPDHTIAYFTTDALPDSPWVRGWRILDWMPFNLKKLRAWLREADVGRVTVKKRGSPLTPEQLTAQLKLKGGSEARTLVLTRFQGEPIVIICDEHPARAT